MLFAIILIAAGLALAAWGLPAAHSLRPPLNLIAAAAVPAGASLALIGILMACAPGFFKG